MGLLFGLLLGVCILVLLVVVHEIGHGIVARRNGVEVEEFGIGFPPLAWGRKIKKSFLGKNVLYSVNWLPLGGFVRLKGEYDSATVKGGYGAASYWVKTKIVRWCCDELVCCHRTLYDTRADRYAKDHRESVQHTC